MNVEEEYDEAGKEEEQGCMQQRGQDFDCPWNVQLVDALRKECPNTRPLERAAPGMSDSKVSACPLL
jgi:hypothetical protein